MVKHQRTQTLLMQTPASIPDAFTPNIPAARAPIAAALGSGRDLLTEVEAKAVLRAYGFSVVDTQLARPPDAAVAAAVAMGFPVVMKIVSPSITHKSDVGGVVLNLETPEAVRSAALAMTTRVMRQQPGATITGFSIQQMISHDHAHELILGVATDPVFGPIILVGDGGVAVEVLADQAIALPPLNMMLAQDMLSRTRVHRLLRGYRDRPPVDLDAIAVDLVRLSQLIIDLPEIIELDINPLLVSPKTTIALDARIRVATARGDDASRLSIRPYPIELEEHATLQDGQRVLLRPIRPEDEAAHLAFCEKVDPQDMYFRFFTRARDFSHTQLARYTQIDYDREMAFIAVDTANGETLGVVRAVSDANNDAAEFAILVRTDMQGQGLGTLLMRKIVAYSLSRGTGRLYGHVLQNNSGMLKLAEQLGFKVDYNVDDSVAVATLHLTDSR
jgi:acetyltransferase